MARDDGTDGSASGKQRAAAARKSNSMNPYEGKRGFFNNLNRIVYTFTGPAQVGIGRPEAPYEAPADPACPICGHPMAEHIIDRTGERTQLHCPA